MYMEMMPIIKMNNAQEDIICKNSSNKDTEASIAFANIFDLLINIITNQFDDNTVDCRESCMSEENSNFINQTNIENLNSLLKNADNSLSETIHKLSDILEDACIDTNILNMHYILGFSNINKNSSALPGMDLLANYQQDNLQMLYHPEKINIIDKLYLLMQLKNINSKSENFNIHTKQNDLYTQLTTGSGVNSQTLKTKSALNNANLQVSDTQINLDNITNAESQIILDKIINADAEVFINKNMNDDTISDKINQNHTSNYQFNQSDDIEIISNEKDLKNDKLLKTLNGKKVADDIMKFNTQNVNFMQHIEQYNNIYKSNKLIQQNIQFTNYIINKVSDKINFLVKDRDVKQATLHLNPPSLGKLDIEVVYDKGVLTTKIFTQNDQVKDLIESNLWLLKQNLQQQGVDISNLSVSVNTGNSRKFENFNSNQRSRIRNTVLESVSDISNDIKRYEQFYDDSYINYLA